MVHRYCKYANPSNVNVDANGTVYATSGATGSGLLTTSTTADTQTSMNVGVGFTFGDLTESSTYETLYDQYKIDRVIVYIELINNPDAYLAAGGTVATNFANVNNNFYPRLWYIRDHDDNTVVSIATIKNYAGVKERILQPNKKIAISIKPSVLQALQGTTNFKVDYKPGWLDMADPNIVHYGLKMCMDFMDMPADHRTYWRIRMTAKYYFACKTPR
jgi:hypothetical protein